MLPIEVAILQRTGRKPAGVAVGAAARPGHTLVPRVRRQFDCPRYPDDTGWRRIHGERDSRTGGAQQCRMRVPIRTYPPATKPNANFLREAFGWFGHSWTMQSTVGTGRSLTSSLFCAVGRDAKKESRKMLREPPSRSAVTLVEDLPPRRDRPPPRRRHTPNYTRVTLTERYCAKLAFSNGAPSPMKLEGAFG